MTHTHTHTHTHACMHALTETPTCKPQTKRLMTQPSSCPQGTSSVVGGWDPQRDRKDAGRSGHSEATQSMLGALSWQEWGVEGGAGEGQGRRVDRIHTFWLGQPAFSASVTFSLLLPTPPRCRLGSSRSDGAPEAYSIWQREQVGFLKEKNTE